MGAFCHFYHIRNLLQQPFYFESVLVFLTGIEDKADSLEALDSLLILRVGAREVAVRQADFGQILSEGFVIFVDADHPVDDFGPVVQGVLVANEEVIFIEYSDYAFPKRLDKYYSCLLKQIIEHFRCTFCENHVIHCLILDRR